MGGLQLAMMENKQCSEIHVAPDLIQELPALPPGQCFSLDALHTTQATVQAINQAEQDYLLPVKQNRAATDHPVQTLTQTQVAQSSAALQDDSHGRRVQRQIDRFKPPADLLAKYPQMKTVARLQRSGTREQKSFSETVFYLSSRDWSADDRLAATRGHWQIENGLHWVKDVGFKEDDPIRRGGHTPVNWAIMNTFCITLARRQGFRTVPQALRSWANLLNEIFHFFV